MQTGSIGKAFFLALLAGVTLCAPAAAEPGLQIYFIDVEGGQSTLVVTPGRHTLLIDTGWAGDGSGFRPGGAQQARDANRILAAARDAGVGRIDYLLITHFHVDHDGGVSELAQLMPIRVFIDHGSPSDDAVKTSPETRDGFAAYAQVRSGAAGHIEPRPGDRLPLGDVEATVVSSAGATLERPLPAAGARNPLCQDQAGAPRDPYENPRSTGVVIRYGRFRFLDLGDLSGRPLFNLACPINMIGPVDAYLVPHHGGPDVADPATFAAFKPRVAVMNNGVSKGGARTTYQALHQVPGLEAVWQLHLSAEAGDSNFAAPYVANLDESTAHWIKLVAREDGSFRILNQRTGEWQEYPAPRR
ncbi:MAG TPA: MBL fold metallo-hydrolase [Steroidobacteraceae bacterium]|nr:MBL fold metallo-hydrolase [Steroidobacteraceae bacterium]